MDYRFTYRDKDGLIWAITDYGPHQLGNRQRQAQRRRRRFIAAGIGLIALNLALICLIGYTIWGMRHG